MNRWVCTVAYDGTEFDGWQSQPSGNAVQDYIEKRLSNILKQPANIHGSGRTDAGVHALGQVFHTDIPWNHGGEALKRALNTGIPDTIRITNCQESPIGSEFHARFSATGKRYTYHLSIGEVSPFECRFVTALHAKHFRLEEMLAATDLFLGKHDFAGFAARREPGVPVSDSIREIYAITWESKPDDRWVLSVEGSGFLYKMVRSIVGSLIQVGLGRLEIPDIEHIIETAKRNHNVNTAPPQGLFLDRVFYPKGKL
ncbi:MAG: tRNA pseudouridine(38-40) synthase TruA [Verrucomicrobiota bacterium]